MSKTILIADDDEAIGEAMQMVLEQEGYQTEVVKEVDTLYHLTKLPDMILLDIWLGGVNGLEICRSLKKNNFTQNIPVVLCSANRNLSELTSQCGAEGYLEKPFEIETLIRLVKSFVE